MGCPKQKTLLLRAVFKCAVLQAFAAVLVHIRANRHSGRLAFRRISVRPSPSAGAAICALHGGQSSIMAVRHNADWLPNDDAGRSDVFDADEPVHRNPCVLRHIDLGHGFSCPKGLNLFGRQASGCRSLQSFVLCCLCRFLLIQGRLSDPVRFGATINADGAVPETVR